MAFTVDMVYTGEMVYTADMVYTVHLVYTVYMVYIRDGRGSYFFHRAGQGGEGLGKKCTGRGTSPFPTVWGGAGKGSKSAGRGGAGAGNILRVSAD